MKRAVSIVVVLGVTGVSWGVMEGCGPQEPAPLPTCGNGMPDDGEDCDPNGFGSDTCEQHGLSGGGDRRFVSCTDECTFDTSQCIDALPAPCEIASHVTCGMFNTPVTSFNAYDSYDGFGCTPAITADVSGPEVAYVFTATVSGPSTVLLEGPVGSTLVVFEASTDTACTTTCLATGAEDTPGTYQAMFDVVAGHRYVAVIDTPAGSSLANAMLYWDCPM